MEEIDKEIKKYFFFKTLIDDVKVSEHRLKSGRYVLGRSDSSDIQIHSPHISTIHAVIEVGEQIKIFDMNSLNGITIDGQKKIVANLEVGEKISIANLSFILMEGTEYLLPSQLESGYSRKGRNRIHSQKNDIERKNSSAYVYEDASRVLPVFSYDSNLDSVEVQISKSDRIYSINFLDITKGPYYLAGFSKKLNDIDCPFLEKNERKEFLNFDENDLKLFTPDGFEINKTGEQNSSREIVLNPNDIVILKQNDIVINIKRSTPPPRISRADLWEKDRRFLSILILSFLFVIIGLIGLSLINVDESISEEKSSKRLVRIILDKKKYLEKMSARKNKLRDTKPIEETAKIIKSDNPTQGKKAIVKNSKPKTKNSVRVKQVSKNTQVSGRPTRGSEVNRKTKGKVETFNSSFKGMLDNVLSNGGSIGSINTNRDSSGSSGLNIGQGSGKVKLANETSNITGSNNNIDTKGISISKGAQGLSKKRSFIAAKFLGDTVIYAGSMDSGEIDRILRSYIPQFRVCGNKQPQLSSSVKMNFIIGSSGHVVKSIIQGPYNNDVKRCIDYVLKGIQFPRPKGGGIVEVMRPIGFRN